MSGPSSQGIRCGFTMPSRMYERLGGPRMEKSLREQSEKMAAEGGGRWVEMRCRSSPGIVVMSSTFFASFDVSLLRKSDGAANMMFLRDGTHSALHCKRSCLTRAVIILAT